MNNFAMYKRKCKLFGILIILLALTSCINNKDAFQENLLENNMGSIEGNIFGSILRHEDWYF